MEPIKNEMTHGTERDQKVKRTLFSDKEKKR
jgi:hypothetical protein